MKTKFIAVMLVTILLMSDIAFAAVFDPVIKEKDQDLFGRELSGDAIFVEVAGYEPTIVPASVLNDQEIPVYVYLKGTTLGGLTLDSSSPESAPFYGLPKIIKMQVKPKGTSASYFTGDYRYIKPIRNELTSDNRFYDLGYLIMNVRKVEVDDEIPEVIDADFTARIEFELENSFGSFGAQDLILKENLDEEAWKESPKGDFWGRTGFVRVNKIEDDKVSLQIYDGLLRSLSFGSVTVNKGDTSYPLRIPRANTLTNDQFRIRVNDIVDDKDKAEIRISRNSGIEYKWVFEGQPIYYGSKWVVKEIRNYVGSDGSIVEEVSLEDSDGNVKYLNRMYTGTGTVGVVKESTGAVEEEIEGDELIYQNRVSSEFAQKVLTISENLKINPNFLMAIMYFETGGRFESDTENMAGSGAVGLIQFIPSTAIGLGTTTKKLSKMSEVDQLDYVEMYFKPYKGKLITIEDTYMAVLRPSGIGKEGSYGLILKSEESRTYNQNIGLDLNRDKIITKSEASQKVKELYLKGIESIGVVGEETPMEIPEKEILQETVEREFCSNADLIDLNEIDENTKSEAVLCKSIHELETYLSNYGEDANRNEIYYYLGLNYEQMGYYSEARNNLQKIDTDSEYYGLAVKKLEEIYDKDESKLKEIPLYLDEENVQLVLKSVELSSRDGTKIMIRTVFGSDVLESAYSIGSRLKYGDDTESLWYIKNVDSGYVTLAAKFSDEDKEREQRLYLNRGEEAFTIDKDKILDKIFVASLKSIDRSREAYLTVLPGSGRAISETDFSVHIPVEDYGIKFSDEQIDAQINWTEKAIATMTGIINKLDNIIQIGNYVCWGMWGTFTLKNLFTPDLNKARRLVMNGIDGKSGVNAICKDKVKPSYARTELEKDDIGLYSTYDECVFANRKQINELIEASKTSIDESKNIGNDKIEDELKKYGSTDGYQVVTENELREYKKLEELNKQLGNVKGDFADSFNEQVEDVYNKGTKDLKSYSDAVEEANKAINEIELSNDEKRNLWKSVYNRKINEEKEEVSIEFIDDYTTQEVFSGKEDKIYTFDNNKKIDLKKLTIEEYKGKLKELQEAEKNNERKEEIGKEISRLNRISNQESQAVTSDGIYLFKEDKNNGEWKIFASTTTVEGIRTTYAEDARAETYSNGRLYRLPTGDGNYAEVLEYYATGSPKTVAEWNVGTDGKLGTEDDVLLKSDSELKLQGNIAEEGRLKQQVTRAGVCEEGESITVEGRRFLCDASKSRLEKQLSSLQCTDVFSITECQLLFNFCDPVMCPASRFNLGGRYQVDNVVQTGLIGSLVLGMPNWAVFSRSAQFVPPVCLTGISSSTKSYRSMLEGYNECLKISKEEGKNVGICEKIRSIFWCELAWREAVAIGKAAISISNTKDVYDYIGSGGGGEYSLLQSLASDTADSAKFFTQEYAKNAFAAYKARSTNEIGTAICKAFIGAKGPELGKFLDELTRPESPPQFTAYFDEKPWSTDAGVTTLTRQSGLGNVEEQSLYNVYYHIYAGEDQDVRYTVFLRDEIGNVAYVTDRVGGYNGLIKAGSYSDKNLDFIGVSGYKEICVVINGQTECGFGKASTSFGLNRLSDEIVQGDSEKTINSAEECTPEYNGPSTSINGFPVVLPTNVPGVTTQNGIVRLCSIRNPGTGSEAERYYESVGTCGTDNIGRNLGSCWIDLRTVTRAIKSTDLRENVTARYGEELTVSDELAKYIFDIIEEYLMNDGNYRGYFIGNKEEFVYNLDALSKDSIQVWFPYVEFENNLKEIINSRVQGSYRDLSNYNFGYYGKKSQIRIGQIYYALGKYLRDKEVIKEEQEKLIERRRIEGSKTVTPVSSLKVGGDSLKEGISFSLLFKKDSTDFVEGNMDKFWNSFYEYYNDYKDRLVKINLYGYSSEEENNGLELSYYRAEEVKDLLLSILSGESKVPSIEIVEYEDSVTNKFNDGNSIELNRRVNIAFVLSENPLAPPFQTNCQFIIKRGENTYSYFEYFIDKGWYIQDKDNNELLSINSKDNHLMKDKNYVGGIKILFENIKSGEFIIVNNEEGVTEYPYLDLYENNILKNDIIKYFVDICTEQANVEQANVDAEKLGLFKKFFTPVPMNEALKPIYETFGFKFVGDRVYHAPDRLTAARIILLSVEAPLAATMSSASKVKTAPTVTSKLERTVLFKNYALGSLVRDFTPATQNKVLETLNSILAEASKVNGKKISGNELHYRLFNILKKDDNVVIRIIPDSKINGITEDLVFMINERGALSDFIPWTKSWS